MIPGAGQLDLRESLLNQRGRSVHRAIVDRHYFKPYALLREHRLQGFFNKILGVEARDHHRYEGIDCRSSGYQAHSSAFKYSLVFC
jgi:hypothetical protein